jgi:hypothetical protein
VNYLRTTETVIKVLRTKFAGDAIAYNLFYGTIGAVTSFFIAVGVGVPTIPFVMYYVASTIIWNMINWTTGGIYGRFLDKWRLLWNSMWERISKKLIENRKDNGQSLR